MNKYIFPIFLTLLVLLSACGGKPAPPWRAAAVSYMDAYQEAFLRGDDHIADVNFRKALQEIQTSGDVPLLAKAHLIRAGLKVAVLEPITEQQVHDFQRMEALYPSVENRNYFYYITGRFDDVDPAFLPPQHQAVARAFQNGDSVIVQSYVEKLQDPLAYLVAMALFVRHQPDPPPETLQRAVDSASYHGWKKPLIAYLTAQQAGYRARGDTANVARISQHLEIINR